MKRTHVSRFLSLVLASSIALAAVVLGSCAPPGPRPNIVIIVMDTVRQDHLSCYGHERDTTPNLRELARESTTYRESYSVGSWTAPAHASLFTGLHPAAHGSTQENQTLAGDLVTLAEVLAEAGYQTVGITENPTIAATLGFGQGFETYHEAWRSDVKLDVANENPAYALFERSLEGLDRNAPFFMFVNFIEPHAPYTSSQEFMNTWADDPESGPDGNNPREFYLGQMTFSGAEFDHMKALYDAEILFTDHQIGRIIELLKRESAWEDTIFIVTSDHGENIGDHGHMDHYFSLYESTVKIPLIVRYPPVFPPDTVDTEPTQITDLYPTLLHLLKLDSGDAQGADLLDPEARKNRPVLCEYYWPAYALQTFQENWDDENLNQWKRHLRAVIINDEKFVWASDGNHELYDLAEDPGEERNLIGSPETTRDEAAWIAMVESLIHRYSVERGGNALPDPPELDEETKEALRALGYLQ